MADREFPCHGCGANLEFKPGSNALQCPYCGTENRIPTSEDEVRELDFEAALRRGTEIIKEEKQTVRCPGCGATTTLEENVTTDRCPFCDTPLSVQAEVQRIIKPQAVLPFGIDQKEASEAFARWLSSRWFAPNDLKLRARKGTIDGVYIPYWTYDCNTETYYRGQRGEHYYVEETYTTVENGEEVTKTRQVQKTRWYPASGVVWVSFDDLLIVASEGVPRGLTQNLEPWDLEALQPFDEAYLTGFKTECYQIDVGNGFSMAKNRMTPEIDATVRRDIGGDAQRVSSQKTQHYNITYKHVLLPIWISAYRYQERVFQFVINARTGEVQGERPYSWVKITFTVLAIIAVAVVIYFFARK